MYDHILLYANDIVSFRTLSIEEQLDLVADIVAYWAHQKIDALDAAGKTRTDSCIPAQRAEAIEKQFQSYNLNLKKKIDLETEKLKRGV